MSTTTLLGALRVEGHQDIDQAGVGPDRVVTASRPTDRILRNDGIQRYWLHAGATYRLAHDGTGWHVTSDAITDGHVYRLAEAQDAAFVETIETLDGVQTLRAGTAYEIRENAPLGAWELHATA